MLRRIFLACLLIPALHTAKADPPDAESALGALRALDAAAQVMDGASFERLVAEDYVGKVGGYRSNPTEVAVFSRGDLKRMLDQAKQARSTYTIERRVESVIPSYKQDLTHVRGQVVERLLSDAGNATLESSFSMAFAMRDGRTILVWSVNTMATGD